MCGLLNGFTPSLIETSSGFLRRDRPMIRVEQVSKSFGDQVVLDDISLEVRQGEILVILGESGTGKSVLLKHMIGLLKPDKGRILIGEQEITRLPERDLLKIRKNI